MAVSLDVLNTTQNELYDPDIRGFLQRLYLYPELEKWGMGRAAVYAGGMIERFAGRPLILLGTRVASAFGVTKPCWEWDYDYTATPLVRIPHPSGLNRSGSTPAGIACTRMALNQAIKRFYRPNFVVGGVCSCGQRPETHLPMEKGGVTLRVLCGGMLTLPSERY